METLQNGKPDKTKNEHDSITKWINSFTFPVPPVVELEGNKAKIKAIQDKFNKALQFAVKQNNLPF